MIAVGIDVSKGKSTVGAKSSSLEVVLHPFEVQHNVPDIQTLVMRLKALKDEDIRIIVESTGRYHEALAAQLVESGFFVDVINPLRTSGFDNDSLHCPKTDQIDPLKLASFGLEKWSKLKGFRPSDAVYTSLKDMNRLVGQYDKQLVASKNSLTSLLDVVYPDIADLFKSNVRKDGHQKWMDFVMTFWHCRCVSGLSQKVFCDKYQKWCRKHRYQYAQAKASEIYQHAKTCIAARPKDNTGKLLVTVALQHVIHLQVTIQILKNEMLHLASTLPEYSILTALLGVGDTLGPQLIAEMGDIRRFPNKKKLVAYAGIDPPPFQSGKFESKNRHMSKRGPSLLRKALFLVMRAVLVSNRMSDPVYQFLDRKRTEGKPYLNYMMAGARKFLLIYYARAREQLNDWPEDA